MNITTRLLIAATVCVAVAACTKKVKEEAPPPAEQAAVPATPAPVAETGKYGPEDLDTDSCLRQRVVYFDFDQETLKPEFQAAIACHTKYLRDRSDARMTLEGNADERGTREYNLGLGERRGNAVSSAIGAASQISVVSYGEERPTCTDSNEDCWSKNRRVEIVYTVK